MAAMNMNQEQFEQAIREEKPVLVDFWTLWWLSSARNKLQQTAAILVQMIVLLICFMSQGQSTVISG